MGASMCGCRYGYATGVSVCACNLLLVIKLFANAFCSQCENIRKAYIEYVVNSPESMAILKKLQKHQKVADKLE